MLQNALIRQEIVRESFWESGAKHSPEYFRIRRPLGASRHPQRVGMRETDIFSKWQRKSNEIEWKSKYTFSFDKWWWILRNSQLEFSSTWLRKVVWSFEMTYQENWKIAFMIENGFSDAFGWIRHVKNMQIYSNFSSIVLPLGRRVLSTPHSHTKCECHKSIEYYLTLFMLFRLPQNHVEIASKNVKISDDKP